MKSIITRSLFFVLFSFVIILLIFFLNSNYLTPKQFLNSLNYLIYESFGLVVIFSQFLYVISYKKLTWADIVLNTIIVTIIFNLIHNFYPDINKYTLQITEKEILHVERAVIDNFNLMKINSIKYFLHRVHQWDLIHYPLFSSFSILLFNFSMLYLISKRYPNYLLLKFLLFVIYFILIIYFWHFILNSVLILLAFIMMGLEKKIEVN